MTRRTCPRASTEELASREISSFEHGWTLRRSSERYLSLYRRRSQSKKASSESCLAMGEFRGRGTRRRGAIAVNFSEGWIFPSLLDLVMRQGQLKKYRRDAAAAATGRVLEIGVGSGLNFPFYGEQVEIVFGIDPSFPLLAIARRRADPANVQVRLIQASAIAIPFADNTMDTIVMTWALCSISEPFAALREMGRVLKPGGKLLFVEHGFSPELRVERWQRRLTPIWAEISGSCHLNRKMASALNRPGSKRSARSDCKLSRLNGAVEAMDIDTPCMTVPSATCSSIRLRRMGSRNRSSSPF